MNYLTREEVLSLNQVLTNQSSTHFGLVSEAALQKALERPAMKIDDYEPFPSLWAKAAALMDGLLKAQCFLKQNTQTTVIATHLFLNKNGFDFVSQEEDIEYIQGMYLQQLTIPQISEWLKSRSTEIE